MYFYVPLSVGSCLAALVLVDLWSMLSHILIYDHCKRVARFWFYIHVVSMAFYPCNRLRKHHCHIAHNHLQQGVNSEQPHINLTLTMFHNGRTVH
jgi:hypothetical protein